MITLTEFDFWKILSIVLGIIFPALIYVDPNRKLIHRVKKIKIDNFRVTLYRICVLVVPHLFTTSTVARIIEFVPFFIVTLFFSDVTIKNSIYTAYIGISIAGYFAEYAYGVTSLIDWPRRSPIQTDTKSS